MGGDGFSKPGLAREVASHPPRFHPGLAPLNRMAPFPPSSSSGRSFSPRCVHQSSATSVHMSTAPMKKVVITGLGVVSGVGTGVENFWEGLLAGKSSIDRVEGFDPEPFKCQIGSEVSLEKVVCVCVDEDRIGCTRGRRPPVVFSNAALSPSKLGSCGAFGA